ncbi:hypothetical protein VC83_08012 [Pseudogymnoascus destructans]|uniref:Uncharacterized protein n=1 Tax=Pseudogymnoascus destructans TaxID=655981 RepID=A0A177A118_9PEZI|nr:uncharacterized protein VC83_08012 [Pseudogymnoascus destructans]OAF55848.1 hypothetical protein VC83_08012 [Pseudogymnoascus destructans]
MVLKQDTGEKVSAIKSIPSKWSYTAGGNSDGSSDYGLMIWLAALGGAGPISATGSPIASVTVADHQWNLCQISSFDGDLKAFYTYLGSSQGFSSSQYVTSIGAGTEPFVGTNALMKTSGHSVALNV